RARRGVGLARPQRRVRRFRVGLVVCRGPAPPHALAASVVGPLLPRRVLAVGGAAVGGGLPGRGGPLRGHGPGRAAAAAGRPPPGGTREALAGPAGAVDVAPRAGLGGGAAARLPPGGSTAVLRGAVPVAGGGRRGGGAGRPVRQEPGAAGRGC